MKRVILFLWLVILFCTCFSKMTESEKKNGYSISENIKSIEKFLKDQSYFEEVSHLCDSEKCYPIDVHDLKNSIENIETKVLSEIEKNGGKEKAIQVQLKGFLITKILTR